MTHVAIRLASFTIAFAGIVLTASASGSDPEILAYWSFDETDGSAVYDLVGKNHAQLNKAPRVGEGRLGSAVSFSGDGTYAQVGEPQGIGFDAAESFSISAWIRLSEDRKQFPFGMEILHCVDRANGNKGVSLSVLGTTANGSIQKIIFHIGEREGSSLLRVLTKEGLSLDRWHHVVATYDGSGKAHGMRVFVNGKLAEVEIQHDSLRGPIAADVPLQIGSSYVTPWQMYFQFKGLIDEVSLWKGALDEPRVRLLYQTDGPHVLSESSGVDTIGLLVLLGGAMAAAGFLVTRAAQRCGRNCDAAVRNGNANQG